MLEPAQILFAFVPSVTPQGDGSFIIRPGKPRRLLTVLEAALRAHCSTDTIYRLIDFGLVEFERPSPRKILVIAESLEEHLARTRDPEFWAERRRAEPALMAQA